jgi:hypothetical protein
MTVMFQAATEPPASRRDYWQHVVGEAMGSLEVRMAGAVGENAGRVVGDLGAVAVGVLEAGYPGGADRRSRHLHGSDPRPVQDRHPASGTPRSGAGRRQALLRPGDLTLEDLARPARGGCRPAGWSRSSTPGLCCPAAATGSGVWSRRPSAVTGARLRWSRPWPARWPNIWTTRTRPSEPAWARPSSTSRASSSPLPRTVNVPYPPETRQRSLLLRIQSFAGQRLDDPALSPRAIADAHFISIRYLHRLFEQHELTVAGWIRERSRGARWSRARRRSRSGRPVRGVPASTRRSKATNDAGRRRAIVAARRGEVSRCWRAVKSRAPVSVFQMTSSPSMTVPGCSCSVAAVVMSGNAALRSTPRRERMAAPSSSTRIMARLVD